MENEHDSFTLGKISIEFKILSFFHEFSLHRHVIFLHCMYSFTSQNKTFITQLLLLLVYFNAGIEGCHLGD